MNRRKLTGESGFFNSFMLVVATIAICATALAILLTPAAATSGASTKSTTAYVGLSGYFPNEFANQAKEIAPQPATF